MVINLKEYRDKKKEQAALAQIRERAKQVKWPGDPE